MGLFNKSDNSQSDALLEELLFKVAGSRMPPHAKKIADKEIELLKRISATTSEYTISLTYIEYLASLPWDVRTEDNLDLERAKRILNENHYGLDNIKDRIIEHLAVKKLKSDRKPRLLVVDDENIALKNLEHILVRENYSVVTASTGKEALKKLEQAEFDVILTDLKMEEIDGMEILKRSKLRSPNTEVVMITGYATIDTAVESMKKGAFHYISKPFKLDEIRETVRLALDKRTSKKETKGSILCFSGPPGTGKTSLGRSIAHALGRRFSRISLGGIKDEAEIRGHRRTYAGAMPGRIIEEIKRTGTCNPVIILDEADKMGQDIKGDTASALLEVLDPEQNHSFTDHYLDMPFDLSDVMFIITANIADNIIEPLRDRMEVVQFSGYTDEEKLNIASHFLIPKQIKETGLLDYPPEFTKDSIYKIIREYTYEAGIRNLEREISSVCRKIAKDFVEHDEHARKIIATPDSIKNFLGPRKYYHEVAEGKDRIGVATGLVWTEAGGDIIFIETARMLGKQQLILTGSLGDVMRESAQTALSYIRSNASKFGIPDNFFEGHDIHIHVPAGAIPKDGPSSGTTIALALISLLTEKPAKRDVAVSGELTLSGRILPVGGIKEKILAAKRAMVKTVILPFKNKAEIEILPEELYKDLNIIFTDSIEEIADFVLVRH